MEKILNTTGTLSGSLGVILCIISGLTRISGSYYLAGYEAATIFTLGLGLLLFACLMKLEVLVQR